MTSRRTRRWWAIFVLVALGFAQASLVAAACVGDRGHLAEVIAPDAAATHECCDEPEAPPANLCVAHCTSDLQAFGWPALAFPPPAAIPLALVSLPEPAAPSVRHPPVPPPRIPPRILLHAYLV